METGGKTEKETRRLVRILAYILGAVSLLTALLAYETYISMGFPDGFIGAWDGARKILLASVMGVSVSAAAWFGLLGFSASQKRVGTKLWLTSFLYAAFVVALFIAESHYARLSGQGG